MTLRAVTARVTGRVQGVAFRAWAAQRARDLGLTGWVRNEPDGSVTGYFAGDAVQVGEMVSALYQGSPFARVDTVEIGEADPAGSPADFRITGRRKS